MDKFDLFVVAIGRKEHRLKIATNIKQLLDILLKLGNEEYIKRVFGDESYTVSEKLYIYLTTFEVFVACISNANDPLVAPEVEYKNVYDEDLFNALLKEFQENVIKSIH